MNPMQWMDNVAALAEVARGHGFVESFLDLMVDELDEGIILLGQFLLQDLVVLSTNLLHPLCTHSLSNHAHLLECEDGLFCLLFAWGGHCHATAACPLHHRGLHRFRRRRSRDRGRGALLCLSPKFPYLLKPLHFIPQVVGDLFGSKD